MCCGLRMVSESWTSALQWHAGLKNSCVIRWELNLTPIVNFFVHSTIWAVLTFKKGLRLRRDQSPSHRFRPMSRHIFSVPPCALQDKSTISSALRASHFPTSIKECNLLLFRRPLSIFASRCFFMNVPQLPMPDWY
jgi:hypothetical protein